MLKLIIMLNSLKEYSIMHNATSWLGFEDGTHPEVSKEIIKDLIASLNNIFSSFLNFYAVSTFFVKYYDKLDIQDKTTIFFIFKDEMDNIHPTLQENLKNSLKTNEISKNLQFDYFSINKVNSLSLKMLENMSREKVFISKHILSYLKTAEMTRDSETTIQIIKYILSLLSNTQINLQIYKKLHEIIENKSLWSQLSFNDTLNYLLISTYFHSSALYPNFLVDSFFSEIHFTDKLEDLNKNPKNSLFYYKSWKYTTELHPRNIVSNDIIKRTDNPQLNLSTRITPDDLKVNSKIHAVCNWFNKSLPSVISDTKKSFYKERDKDFTFNELRNSVEAEIDQISKKTDMVIEKNFFDEKTGWRCEFFCKKSRIGIILITDADKFFNEDKTKEVALLQKIIQSQLETQGKLKIINFCDDTWYDLPLAIKSSVFDQFFGDLNKLS